VRPVRTDFEVGYEVNIIGFGEARWRRRTLRVLYRHRCELSFWWRDAFSVGAIGFVEEPSDSGNFPGERMLEQTSSTANTVVEL
jgi:hypothetical protein